MRFEVKLLGVLAMLLIAAAEMPVVVDGGRNLLKDDGQDKADVHHPENFFGGVGGLAGRGAGAGIFTGVPGIGPVDFCSVPGLGCVRVEPTNPGGGGVGGISPPLPFP